MAEDYTATSHGLRILLALDAGFEQLASVALASLLRHNQIERVVVSTPEADQFTSLANIAAGFHTPLQQFTIGPDAACQRLTQAVRPYFYCLEAMDLVCHGDLAHDPGRYLYLDADTLCVRELTELSRLPLSKTQPLAACSHGRPMPDRQLVLGLESPYHYFNAGVLLFDSTLLAEQMSSHTAVSFYQNNQALCRFREQCALNGLMRGKVQYLPSQYNYLSWMRPRVQHLDWHQLNVNPMAYCLPNAREQLAIAHLSAGALPSQIPPERLEEIDHYWLRLAGLLSNNSSAGTMERLPSYSAFRTELAKPHSIGLSI